MMQAVERAIRWEGDHVLINNSSHLAGGFATAMLLQRYFKGSALVPAPVAWAALAYAGLIHLRALTSRAPKKATAAPETA